MAKVFLIEACRNSFDSGNLLARGSVRRTEIKRDKGPKEKENDMKKKLTALLLALSLTLTLTACGGDTQVPAEDTIGAETGETVSGDADLAEPDDGEADDAQDDTQTSEDETGAETEKEPVQPESTSKPVEKPAETKPAETTPTQKPQENAKPETEQPTAKSVDLSAFYQSLLDTYGAEFPADANVSDNAELLDSFYPGLSGVATRQVVIYQPMMSSVVCEIVLVEVENAADVQTVKDICQARIDYQVGDGTRPGGAWYPESMEGWENDSRIVSNGNYVMLIAYSGCDAVVSAFNGLF